MDVDAGNNEGSTNIADIEAKHIRASRAGKGASNSSNSSPAGVDLKPFGEDGLTFGDILDVINPLQHIPVISTIYRNLTGDELSPAARIAGGALFGGPIGLVAGVANTAVLAFSGKDIGESIVAAFSTTDKIAGVEVLAAERTAANNTQVASATSLRTGQPLSLLPDRSIDQRIWTNTRIQCRSIYTVPFVALNASHRHRCGIASTDGCGSQEIVGPRTSERTVQYPFVAARYGQLE